MLFVCYFLADIFDVMKFIFLKKTMLFRFVPRGLAGLSSIKLILQKYMASISTRTGHASNLFKANIFKGKKSYVFILASYFFSFGISQNVWANITVYPMETTIKSKASSTTIDVVSQVTETQFIKVYAKKVLRPATKEEHEEDVQSFEGEGLILSPQKFALAGGTTCKVLVISLAQPQDKALYRVYFEQVSDLDEAIAAEKDKLRAEVKINIIWSAMVHVIPNKLFAQFVANHNKDGTYLSNNGNARVRVEELRSCANASQAKNDAKGCPWQAFLRNIYPKEQVRLPTGLAKPNAAMALPVEVKFQLLEAGEKLVQEVK